MKTGIFAGALIGIFTVGAVNAAPGVLPGTGDTCTAVCVGSGCMSQGSATLVSSSYTQLGCAASGYNIYTIPGDSSGKQFALTSCNSGCACGSTSVSVTITNGSYSCTGSFTQCSDPGCSNCTSDTTWTAVGTGYEKRVVRSCEQCSCNATTQYRCAAGYYGSSTNGTSGCTKCPTVNGVTGTSPAGSTSSSACCAAGSSVSFSDTAGSGTYTDSSCCYQ